MGCLQLERLAQMSGYQSLSWEKATPLSMISFAVAVFHLHNLLCKYLSHLSRLSRVWISGRTCLSVLPAHLFLRQPSFVRQVERRCAAAGASGLHRQYQFVVRTSKYHEYHGWCQLGLRVC